MKIDQRENLIRRYLLGELAEADQTALEQELRINRGKFDQVWGVENELIDSYVRGEMSRADRNRFESHYLASPLHRERVAIAESFLTNIDQAVGEAVEVREVTTPPAKAGGFFRKSALTAASCTTHSPTTYVSVQRPRPGHR